MTKIMRTVSDSLLWYAHGRCWRFAFRDPYTQERRFLNCTPERFRNAGIGLASPAIVRRDTKVARGLAAKLRDRFIASLDAVVTETSIETAPMLSVAIEKYFELFDQSAGYRKTLRKIFEEFLSVVGDKRVDAIRDADLKRYERKLARRCRRTSVRSYMKQLFMLINFSMRKGWLRTDPRLTYKLPREQIPEPNPYSRDEIMAFFATCETRGWEHIEWIGVGLLALGLRPIELIHARWENLNVGERTLWIDKSHGAKERQARQHQPIPVAVWSQFVKRRRASGPIWLNAGGDELTMRALDRFRRTVAKRIPGFTFKRFRKTFATVLAEAGNDIIVVSRLLRHSLGGKSMSIAQRHYVGQDLKRLRGIVDEAFEWLAPTELPEVAGSSSEE